MGVKMGLSHEQVKNMNLCALQKFVDAYNDMHSKEEDKKEEEVWATQDDIDRLA